MQLNCLFLFARIRRLFLFHKAFLHQCLHSKNNSIKMFDFTSPSFTFCKINYCYSWEIKKKNFDVIIFFRKGKFFELFEEDADIGAKLLGLKVSNRGSMRLAGVPVDSFAQWAKKLVEKVRFVCLFVCLVKSLQKTRFLGI